jgi:hypothetical protein
MSLKKVIVNDQKDHICICCGEIQKAINGKMTMLLFNKQPEFMCHECEKAVFNYDNWIVNNEETTCMECFLCNTNIANPKDNIRYMPDIPHDLGRWYDFYCSACKYDDKNHIGLCDNCFHVVFPRDG